MHRSGAEDPTQRHWGFGNHFSGESPGQGIKSSLAKSLRESIWQEPSKEVMVFSFLACFEGAQSSDTNVDGGVEDTTSARQVVVAVLNPFWLLGYPSRDFPCVL